MTLRHHFRKGELEHPDRDLIRLQRRRPPKGRPGIYLAVIICPACDLLYMATERGQGCTHCDARPNPCEGSANNFKPKAASSTKGCLSDKRTPNLRKGDSS